MTAKTKTQTNCGDCGQKKKLQSPDSPFSLERLPGVQMMEMAK